MLGIKYVLYTYTEWTFIFIKAKTINTAILLAVLRNVHITTITTQSTGPLGLWIGFTLAHKGQYLFIAIGLKDFTDF